jgi:hypothetical protein
MVLYQLVSRVDGLRRSLLDEYPPAKRIIQVTEGLAPDSSAVTPLIEPVQDGTWVLKMRSVRATASGVPRQWAFYIAVGREASLGVHTASVRDVTRSVEEDRERLRREVGLFDSHVRQVVRLEQLRLRRAKKPATLPEIGEWHEDSINVDGAPTLIRSARIGDRGRIGWWVSGDHIIEIQSDAVPASQMSLSYHQI